MQRIWQMAVAFQSLIVYVFSVMWAQFTEFKIILLVSLSFCVFALSLKEIEETSEVHNKVRQTTKVCLKQAVYTMSTSYCMYFYNHFILKVLQYSWNNLNSYRCVSKISRQCLHFKWAIRQVSSNHKNDLLLELELQTTIKGMRYMVVRKEVEVHTNSLNPHGS